jgi:molecular chaperone GrpE
MMDNEKDQTEDCGVDAGESPVQERPETGEESPEASGEATLSPEEQSAGLQERLRAVEEKLREADDLYLRKAADFENFRKRMTREKQDAIEFANQSLLLDLIPILDDFDRAIKAAEALASTSKEFDSFYEGITLIEKRLVSQLENKWGLRRFDSAGEAFDPNRHEAIMMDKSPDIAEPVVQEDFLKGYTLKDRVVRSAKVRVLRPGESPREENSAYFSGERCSGTAVSERL